MSKKAVILLSGGLDSTTMLYHAKAKGFTPYCLIFEYGQRHNKEIDRLTNSLNGIIIEKKFIEANNWVLILTKI